MNTTKNKMNSSGVLLTIFSSGRCGLRNEHFSHCTHRWHFVYALLLLFVLAIWKCQVGLVVLSSPSTNVTRVQILPRADMWIGFSVPAWFRGFSPEYNSGVFLPPLKLNISSSSLHRFLQACELQCNMHFWGVLVFSTRNWIIIIIIAVTLHLYIQQVILVGKQLGVACVSV